jgi:hypothetical protein
MIKKNLLRGMVILGVLSISAGLSANYIDDAAELIINEELTEKDLVKDFNSKEIAQVKEKVKELKLKNLREQKRVEEEKERNKRLEQLKKKEVGKSSILFDDLEKKVNNRFARLESRVSSLEKNKNKAAQNKSNNNKVISSTAKKVSKKEAIDLILRGKLGDGQERLEKLKKLGFTDSEVKEIQKSVTKIINEDQIKTDIN